jgi:hypothetical protein
MHWQTYLIEFSYLLASILFILGLKGLSHPETAKRGMHLAESVAIPLREGGELLHFCSMDCREKYLAGVRKFAANG